MKTMAAMGLVIVLVGLVALRAPAELRAGVANWLCLPPHKLGSHG